MNLIEHAITASRKSAEHHDPSLAEKPAPKIAILTCMDPHLNDLLHWLDIKPADADVIRNVGTAATSDVVRSLMFSIHVLGVRDIMIIGHTGCGMEMFSEEDFEKHLHTQCGVWAVAPDRFHFYTDVNLATQKQVLKLKSHPWIPSNVTIRGFVYDLKTGELREVTPKNDKQSIDYADRATSYAMRGAELTASRPLRGRSIGWTVNHRKGSVMFCAMLEVNPKADQFDTYFGMAKMLRPELDKIEGFVDNTR